MRITHTADNGFC